MTTFHPFQLLLSHCSAALRGSALIRIMLLFLRQVGFRLPSSASAAPQPFEMPSAAASDAAGLRRLIPGFCWVLVLLSLLASVSNCCTDSSLFAGPQLTSNVRSSVIACTTPHVAIKCFDNWPGLSETEKQDISNKLHRLKAGHYFPLNIVCCGQRHRMAVLVGVADKESAEGSMKSACDSTGMGHDARGTVLIVGPQPRCKEETIPKYDGWNSHVADRQVTTDILHPQQVTSRLLRERFGPDEGSVFAPDRIPLFEGDERLNNAKHSVVCCSTSTAAKTLFKYWRNLSADDRKQINNRVDAMGDNECRPISLYWNAQLHIIHILTGSQLLSEKCAAQSLEFAWWTSAGRIRQAILLVSNHVKLQATKLPEKYTGWKRGAETCLITAVRLCRVADVRAAEWFGGGGSDDGAGCSHPPPPQNLDLWQKYLPKQIQKR